MLVLKCHNSLIRPRSPCARLIRPVEKRIEGMRKLKSTKSYSMIVFLTRIITILDVVEFIGVVVREVEHKLEGTVQFRVQR